MRPLIGILVIIAATLFIGFYIYTTSNEGGVLSQSDTTMEGGATDNSTEAGKDSQASNEPPVRVISEMHEIPWDIAFLPDGSMLVTERAGRLIHVESGTSIEVPGVAHRGEGGLLGIALHPEYERNHFVYLYQTTRSENGFLNRVVRYKYENNTLTENTIILNNIPGALFHDGGRIEFGPAGYLWVTTGDATNEASAQDPSSLAGSILRLHDNGSVPEDNPFSSTGSGQAKHPVWSYGHRNPQGLAWDSAGRLWSTEHGRSGIQSGMDELNLIERGNNYGWPVIEGSEAREGMVRPEIHSGADTTWAPASAAYQDGSIFFGGLRGEALYEVVLDGTDVEGVRRHFAHEFGRIRTVRVGPDGALYLTTSNRDGRGEPVPRDDRIIRVDPALLN